MYHSKGAVVRVLIVQCFADTPTVAGIRRPGWRTPWVEPTTYPLVFEVSAGFIAADASNEVNS
jgi:hypothetical protein